MPSQFRVLRRIGGFTLIELMIVVAIVAILARVALPIYSDYVLRGRLVDATNLLASMRAQMEQYYQDNRTYATSGGFNPPCVAVTYTKDNVFAISCAVGNGGIAPAAATYTIGAKGSGIALGFTYTIDQAGTMATSATSWSNTSTTCWLIKKSDSC